MFVDKEKIKTEIKEAVEKIKKDIKEGKQKNPNDELIDLTDTQIEYLANELQKLLSSKQGVMRFALHSKKIIDELAKKVKQIG